LKALAVLEDDPEYPPPICRHRTNNLEVLNNGSSLIFIDPKTLESFTLWLGQYKADNTTSKNKGQWPYSDSAEGAYIFKPASDQ
jgi:hypothetical protein